MIRAGALDHLVGADGLDGSSGSEKFKCQIPGSQGILREFPNSDGKFLLHNLALKSDWIWENRPKGGRMPTELKKISPSSQAGGRGPQGQTCTDLRITIKIAINKNRYRLTRQSDSQAAMRCGPALRRNESRLVYPLSGRPTRYPRCLQ
jgi:hypothetical protein